MIEYNPYTKTVVSNYHTPSSIHIKTTEIIDKLQLCLHKIVFDKFNKTDINIDPYFYQEDIVYSLRENILFIISNGKDVNTEQNI